MSENHEPLVQGEEAHLTAKNLIDVLGKAFVAAARGHWEETALYSEEAVVLSLRLSRSHPPKYPWP